MEHPPLTASDSDPLGRVATLETALAASRASEARLLESRGEWERALLEHRRDEAHARGLTRLLEDMVNGTPLPRILDHIVAFHADVLGGMETAILLLEEERNRLRVSASAGNPGGCAEAFSGASIRPDLPPFAAVMTRGQPVYVPDAAQDGHGGGFLSRAAALGIRACWSVPVKDREGAVLGVFLAVSTRSQGLPDDGAILRLQQAAHLAGIALGHARSEEALRDSEARSRSLYINTPAMLHSIDAEGRIILASRLWLETLGYGEEEVIGRRSTEFLTPESRKRAESESIPALFRDGSAKDVPFQVVARNGRILDVLVSAYGERDESGRMIRSLAITNDVTALKRTEEMLHRARRLESVGRLAGGVAHQYNNLLTAIQGWTSLALEELPAASPARGHLAEALRACERAATITRQLLAYGRKQVLAARPVDPARALEGMREIILRGLPQGVRMEWRIPGALGTILADPGQLEYVVTGLVSNACKAMPEGGVLTVAAEEADLDASRLRDAPEGSPGPYVMISVGDTGTGMAPDLQARLFEPFLAGMEDGGPSGLGLAAIYGIIKQSGGHIEVESAPGAGSVFKVYFPRLGSRSTRKEPHMESGDRSNEPMATVLMAEDDKIVRQVAESILHRAGYHVRSAADGKEALEILSGPEGGSFDLLLTDILMPRMGGMQLAREAARLRPELPVLFMSGYIDPTVDGPDSARPGPNFLPKPFTPSDLVEKVRNLARKPVGST